VDKTLSFIEASQLQDSIERIDYILYLIGYFAYHKNLDSEKELELVEWVRNTDFGNMGNTARRDEFTKLLNL
jgi:hypothetical protein